MEHMYRKDATEESSRLGGLVRRVSMRGAGVLCAILVAGSLAGVGAARADDCSGSCTTATPVPAPSEPDATPTPNPSGTPDPGDGTPDPGTPAPDPGGTDTPTPAPETPAPGSADSAPGTAGDADSAATGSVGSGVDASAMEELQTALDKAQDGLDSAQAALDSATDQYHAARNAYRDAKALADSAAGIAARARSAATSAAAKLMVAVRQARSEGPATTLGAVVGGSDGSGTLLQRLTAAHQLGGMHAPLSTLTKRAESAAKHAAETKAAAADARRALAAVPLTQKRAEEKAAESAVDAAQSALDAALDAMVSASGGGADADFVDDFRLASGSWVDPVTGPITDVFGPRPSQPAGSAVFHPGVDIGAACMTVIVAAADGTVSYAGPYSGYGNFVLIDHGGGLQTAYGHISDGTIMVSPGQSVTAGQPIARVGSTGESTGCHLHVEVRVNGTAIDPMPFFLNRGVALGR